VIKLSVEGEISMQYMRSRTLYITGIGEQDSTCYLVTHFFSTNNY